MDRFMTVDNAQACVSAFSRYMKDRYEFDISSDKVPIDPKKIVFQVMQQVHKSTDESSNTPVKTLNNIVLNMARDFYVNEFRLDAARTKSEPKLPEALVAKREVQVDPEAFMQQVEKIRQTRQETNVNQSINTLLAPVPVEDKTEDNKDIIIPSKTVSKRIVEKFLSVNGFDRPWESQKARFQFNVEIADGANTRNIHWIEVSKLIVPMEIHDTRSIANVPKQHFNYSFNMSFPFVSLHIDEISGVYDGTTNSITSSAFCQLSYDNAFMSRYGRGFVILKPMSSERKYFYPNPLGSLGRLSFAIRRPNGALWNQSTDSYMLWHVTYEPINVSYLRVTPSKYHDKNEFFVSDTIGITGFVLNRPATATQPQSSYNAFMAFINRPEGHEILQPSQPNDQGFYQGFYIQAPGYFDANQGKFIVDSALIEAMNESNNDAEPFLTPFDNGSIINQSLQVSMVFKMGVEQGDAIGLLDEHKSTVT
jgi:hypothetical protein